MIHDIEYLKFVQYILDNGFKQFDRTGTGTLSVFGGQSRYDLTKGFPLLTTKRVPFQMVVKELLWFLRGQTDNSILTEQNVHIWDGNAGDSNDLGTVYGHNWRYFGAPYNGCDKDYTGKGVDQIQRVLDILDEIASGDYTNSRRMVVSSWDPVSLHEAALPPCHMSFQFLYNQTTNELSLHMYQRSADFGLGVPFNIASYSILLSVIAQMKGMVAKEFIHSFGEAHIYLDHIDQLKLQLEREPREAPKLLIGNLVDETQFDAMVANYNPHPTIKMRMSV